MDNLSKNILEEIKEKHITPRPKWEFLARDYVIWAVFGMLVLVGSIAVSVFIFMITDHDWDIYKYVDKSFAEFFLVSIPYFWIALVAAFSIFAWYDLKKTRTGYKYTFTKIGLVNITLSIVIGIAMFYSGVGMKIENAFANNLPFYRVIHPYRGMNLWDNPDKGLLIGEIISFINDQDFNLQDFQKRDWIISCLDCLRKGAPKIKEGMIVRIIGKKSGTNLVQALEIRPWKMDCGGQLSDLFEESCKPNIGKLKLPPPMMVPVPN